MGSYQDEYARFLANKALMDPPTGLTELPELPAALFPHQRDIVKWALRRGRAAIFAQTGLGKSLMELSWAQAVHQATGRDVLLLAPLAVAGQMVREAEKFGIAAKHCYDGSEVEPGITVTNYQKLPHFDVSRFIGVVLDESSILKAFDGKTRNRLTETFAETPYRLAATATPAPNDFMELGNHAEFLGVMSYTGMLSTFFIHDGGDTSKWRLKGHAENDFWRWMCSWSVLLRKPSDLGYDDGAYNLPPLHQLEHIVDVEGEVARTLSEQRKAAKASLEERVAKAMEIIAEEGVLHGVEAGVCGEPEGERTKRPRVSGEKATAGEGEPGTEQGIAEEVHEGLCEGQPGEVSPHAGATSGVQPETQGGLREGQSGARCRKEESARMADEQPGEAEGATPEAVQPDTGRIRVDAGSPERALQDMRALGYVGPEHLPSGGSLPHDGGSEGLALHKLQSWAWEVQRRSATIGEGDRVPGLRPWVIWCQLNAEQEALEKVLGDLAFSIRGAHKESLKESNLMRWLGGERPILISKPSILGFGLNLQQCADTIFVGLNHSFEQVYQATRRFWRFGQTQPVNVHFIAASTEGPVLENLKRKEADAERMGAGMVAHMADLSSEIIHGAAREWDAYNPVHPMIVPGWLQEAV